MTEFQWFSFNKTIFGPFLVILSFRHLSNFDTSCNWILLRSQSIWLETPEKFVHPSSSLTKVWPSLIYTAHQSFCIYKVFWRKSPSPFTLDNSVRHPVISRIIENMTHLATSVIVHKAKLWSACAHTKTIARAVCIVYRCSQASQYKSAQCRLKTETHEQTN